MLASMLAAENQKQILIVDRDVATVEPLRQQLKHAGFVVLAISDGAAAVVAVELRPPQLVIVDWNMPGLAPLELLECVRKARLVQPLRLIILSDLSGEHEIVSGLNMGADDYIAKPFSVREAVARINAVLRARRHDTNRAALSFDSLTLNTSTNRVTAQGALLNVRGAEYRLLEFLMSHPGKTFNRTQLLAQVWAGSAEIDERTVDVNVQRLRKILAAPGYEACIQTVRGFGYRFIER
ncbi:MAG: two-component system, OmpR family, phosphate regulon response regulator PhoB [Gammaproteobacteria bacterium]|jgi:two-component system phosphate regulon response regulator PhoB|nr:two-component system, OmpR family, phosphate regulon response regulator PhoB [Gammaproteobacteria bacterium]